MDKIMYRVEDIAEDLSIPPEEAEKLLKGLADRMEKAGHLTIRGMVSRAYYERQKEAGFLLDETAASAVRIPLNEKRLLSMEEFCEYAGGIGICTARKHARETGVEVRIGGRRLVDRFLFDEWCSRQNQQGQQQEVLFYGQAAGGRGDTPDCGVQRKAGADNGTAGDNQQEAPARGCPCRRALFIPGAGFGELWQVGGAEHHREPVCHGGSGLQVHRRQ